MGLPLAVVSILACVAVGAACRGRSTAHSPVADVRVSAGGNPFVEATIAAHPFDPLRLVVTASELIPDKGSRPRAFTSRDGGRTWQANPLPEVDERARDGRLSHALNNWVTFSPAGHAYLSTLTSNGQRNEVLVYRSTDGGDSWAGPAVVPSRGLDFPTMSATVRGGRERLYLVATGNGRSNRHLTDAPDELRVFPVFSSDDGGRSFQPASVIRAPSPRGHQAMNIVAVPGQDVVAAPFLEFGFASGPIGARLHVARSDDGGGAFGPPVTIAERPPAPPSSATLAIDGVRRRWYASWKILAEGHERVMVAGSTDGAGWTTSLLAPSAGRPFFPTLAVSRRSVVGVAWLHAAGDAGGCTETRFSHSVDDGRTFSAPRVLSPAACADPRLNADWPITSTAPGGEYMGITAAADGSFHVVWADGRNGPYQVHTARVPAP